MDFQQSEQQFRQLDKQFRAGQIGIEQYKTALIQLRVTDASGNIWQLQERTGAWYVFWQGQWVLATPPGGSSISPQPAAAQSPGQSAPHKTFPWTPVGITAGVVLLVVLLAVGMVYLLKSGSLLTADQAASQPRSSATSQSQPTAATSQPDEKITFNQDTTLTVKAGDSPVQDKHGISLQVPAAALPSDSAVAQLTTFNTGGALAQALDDSYKLETPFYEVSVQGQSDGAGLADLSFPASSPQSRLLVVVDQQYAALLDVKPQDGKLTAGARLGPSDLSGPKPAGSLIASGSIYYAVVTPKKAAGAPSIIPASRNVSQAETGKDCSPISLRAATIFQRCRSNQAGTVMVIFPFRSDLTYFDADHVAQEVESAMVNYAGKGFTAAKLSTSSPMLVVVSDGYSSPEYNFKNGVIYLPPDIPTKLSTENTSLWHEMAHWIQNQVYSLAWARVRSAKGWWMDVSAEMMVMLLKPDYIAGNMATYGTITKSDGATLALQSAPYQWPADFYVHAQLVMVNMCDSGACPLTGAGFVEAINKGTYPFEDSSAQEKLTGNLEDYATYLLGKPPLKANAAISLAAVQTQNSYGQTVTVSKTNKSDLSYNQNGIAPQVQKEAKEGLDNLVINAPIEKDGVYPLQITSGSQGKYTGIPVILVVAPGVAFDYRLDGGEIQVNDGSKELTIGPIHAGLGITTVRLVAYSKTGGQSFQARIEPVDLKGAWVIIPTTLVSNNINCVGGDASNPPPQSAGVAQMGATYFGIIGAMGDMQPDASGLSLDWSMVSSRLPADIKPDQFTFKATALVGSDGIKLQGELAIPKPTAQRSPLPFEPASLAVALLLPAAWLKRISKSKKGRWLGLACVFLLLAFALAGCFGFAMYGSFGADIKITKLEYSGGEGKATWTIGSPIDGKPVWTIAKGTATYPINFTVETSTDDANGKTTTTTDVCTGSAEYEVNGGIYQDITVIIPKSTN